MYPGQEKGRTGDYSMTPEQKKQEFLEEAAKCRPEDRSTLGMEEQDGILEKLDELYGTADQLSLRNAVLYRRILILLSVAATLVTFAFLLYDEAEQHWMILICGIMILCLFSINRIAKKLECHGKYLEYRVLAEAARVQYYVHYSGSRLRISDIFPWPLQMSVPWVKPMIEEIMAKAVPGPKRSIRDCWIADQRQYHIRALAKTKKKSAVNNRIVFIALVLAIALYVFALLFEVRFAGLLTGNSMIGEETTGLIRTILKILLGTVSAATLFTGNYFGKLSLDNAAEDHQRMILLYDKALEVIGAEGETDAMILRLAREELNENSSWYSYQSVNTPNISLG